MERGHIWVVGGDRRQETAARLLAADGWQVHTYALPGPAEARNPAGIGRADCIVLPLPVTRDGVTLNAPAAAEPIPLEELFPLFQPGQVMLGGQIPPDLLALGASRGLVMGDYFLREELAVANAVPTAEGALQLAMEHLPVTLHGARVLVTGFGRVGQITAQRFAALGSRVTVAARSPGQLAMARASGMDPLPLGELTAGVLSFDLVVNTVPAPLLTRPVLAALPAGCLILDLASQPGGTDFGCAKALGLTAIHALALPGKVAPVTAGTAIKEALSLMLCELGR